MSPLSDRAQAAAAPATGKSLTSSASGTGKQYWRSLGRLLDSPAADGTNWQLGQQLGQEFPDGASETPDAVSRRTMLGLMGASFAMAGLAGCRRPVETILPYVQAPETVIPGIARYFASTMPLGASATGVVVESHEGRPTKIEGNELHPASHGAAGAWSQAAVLGLYDPDRSRIVRRRGARPTTADDGHAGEHKDVEHSASAPDADSLQPATWQDFETFWAERATELEAAGGAGLAVLSGAYSSPTQARLHQRLKERFPQARWTTYEPAGDDNSIAGVRLATGTEARPVYRLGRARVVVALDADLLGTESDNLNHSRGFAEGRRMGRPEDGMNRLYAVEGVLSLTGSMADHRLRVKSSQVGQVAAALAAQLAGGAAASGLEGALASRVATMATDLRNAGSAALVVAGRRQPAEVHALALQINQALGSLGRTVELYPLQDAAYGGPDALGELTVAMQNGEVNTLVVLGTNPAYTAPADLDFVAALGGIDHTVHLGLDADETARACEWHLPETHFLEAWGDARSADGTLSVVQPLIAPLHDSRSAIEVLALMVGETEPAGYAQVRASWSDAGVGDQAWRKALHDGVVAGTVAPVSATVTNGGGITAPATGSGLELDLLVSHSVYDGRFANNAWLQELPDPVSKIVWDNALFVSPGTATEQGLESGDQVRISHGELTLEAPVFVLPGVADGTLAIELGYGRRAAGRAGDGVGVDAYALRTTAAPWTVAGVQLEKLGSQQELVQTQEHWSMEGRPLVREASLDEYRAHPDFAPEMVEVPPPSQLFADHDYSEGPQWGMSIDLNACTGCNACVIACQAENNIPVVGREQVGRGREMHWLRIDRYFAGDEVDPEVVFQPIPCMHCENAPCEQVCPVAATVHDRNGINSMVYNRCIGTRYCSNNCPYKVRRFNFFNYTKDTPELVKMAMNPDVTVRSRGVMEKCTYCVQRINEAQIVAKRAERPLVDGDVKTACQQTCPTGAIVFGDITDTSSQVVARKAQERDYTLLEELNNRPRTTFLAKLRNPNPDWGTA